VKVCDWPMLLVQRHYLQLVQGSELDRRLISFFLINVVTWSALAILVMRVCKERFLASGHSMVNSYGD
jgi:hypothetical protein